MFVHLAETYDAEHKKYKAAEVCFQEILENM